MLTDDLIRSLNQHAAEVGQTPADLLSRVEEHADRMQKRHIAVAASVSLLALLAAGTGLTLARHDQGTTRTIGPVGVIAPAPCDEPDGVQPSAYLDWPCASAADDALGARLARAATGVRTFYKGTGTLRMRLLADTRNDGELDGQTPPDDTLVEAWYDGSTRAAVLLEVSGGLAPAPGGVSAFSVPPGHPALILQNGGSSPDGRTGARRVFARDDVASVLFVMGSVSRTVPVTDGVTTLTFPLDGGDGHPHADWEVLPRPAAGSTSGGLFTQIPWDVEYAVPAPQPPTPTLPSTSAAAGYPSGRQLCEDPAAEGQQRYLDWPCAAPADGKVQLRVDQIIASLRGSYRSIRTPHVRLLADTVDDGSTAQGPAVTAIEVWDTSDPRSAVLSSYLQSDPMPDSTAMVVYSNDPGVVVNGSSTADVGLVFARAGITTLRFRHGNVDEPVAVSGGVGLIHLPSAYTDAASWTVTGYDAAGREVAETAWDVDGCAKGQITPCNPLATPAASTH